VKLALLSVLVLFLTTGCSGNSSHGSNSVQEKTAKNAESAKRYTRQEVRWLKRLASWEEKYSAANARADSAYYAVLAGSMKLRDLRRALRPLMGCARGLRKDLGRPPSERLQSAFESLVGACEQERTLALGTAQSFRKSRDRSDVLNEAQEKSDSLGRRAHRSIERLLLAYRPLPVVGGVTRRSRIEPRFSRVASKLALKRVEIRCWSPRDWRAATREWEAYTGLKVEVSGFADGIKRANLSPGPCVALAKFTYKRWRPAQGYALLRVADAVGLLAHETEHLLNPIGSEAETECHAIQDLRHVARNLGANRHYASRLAAASWTTLYPNRLKGYTTRECRNGGLYDINPDTDVWP
jgi:hypothetical protein